MCSGQPKFFISFPHVTVAMLLFSVGLSSAGTEQRTRVIKRSPLAPIAERLEPGDEVVVIQDYPPVTGLVDEPVSIPREIEWLVLTSDAALVADVVGQKGRLVEDGRWINSTISVHVGTVVMEHRRDGRKVLERSFHDGQHLDIFWTHGGEVSIGSVTVRARSTLFEAGRRYLSFVNKVGDEWHLGTRFEIQKDGTLRHLLQPDDSRKYARSPLDGLPLERVVQDLQKESARHQ